MKVESMNRRRAPAQKGPVVKAPIVDRLVFLLPWGAGIADHKTLIAPVARRVALAVAAKACTTWFTRGRRYLQNFRIKLPSGAVACVQIGALQPLIQKGGIRVELNPSRMSLPDIERFHEVMRKIVGSGYDKLLLRPLINRIDIAVDIVGLRLTAVLVHYSYSTRFTVFAKRMGKHGRIEGYNFGSVGSDYMNAVYNKGVENLHRLVERIARDGIENEDMKLNVVKQLKRLKNAPPITRVEIRGKKMRGRHLWELQDMPNRFARFQFCVVDQPEDLRPTLKKAFTAMCRQDGVPAALEAFKGHQQIRKLKKYWRSGAPAWWRPKDTWAFALDHLKDQELFPTTAFVKPKTKSLN